MKKICIILILLTAAGLCAGQVTVQHLLTENRMNPMGIDVAPRFSWQLLTNTKRGERQTAYEIRVTLGGKTFWTSGKVASDQSVQVSYGGPPLESGKKYNWQVRIWDSAGKASPWSETGYWQMGLLKAADWKSKWISNPVEDSVLNPSPLFRKKFATHKQIASATAYITSRGLYEAYINGHRVGDAYLTPGWTSYNKRLQYQQYDVTGLLSSGDNVVGIVLGNGWYRGFIGFSGQNKFYGKSLAALVQIDIQYADRSHELIVSDESWKTSTGSIFGSEIYHGETVDARLEKHNWTSSTYPDGDWAAVKANTLDNTPLIATYNEPIRKHETFKAVKMIQTPRGEKVLDFGQNLVGWVQVKARGKAGDKIILHHAEVLDKAGNFYTENLRPARQENTYILKGGEEEFFEPHFTFQGFRYIRIDGYPGEIKLENFTAVALYSDMQPTGTFTCSNGLVNQLQHNIQWGQRGNFLDVPTDCPQRDERLGWTGDAQAFSRTATFNFGVNNFFSKWLKDLAADQVDGSVPFVVPNVLSARAGGSTGWADAATIIPWNLYLAYGDKRVLEDQYESMKAWVDYMNRNSTDYLWNKGFHFGDWLFYRPFDDNDGRSAVTDKYLIAQCFFAHSTGLVVKAANVLGKTADAAVYAELQQKVKDAFVKEYVTAGGRLVSSTQTAYVLALNFDMLPEAMRDQAADKLVANIKSYGNHLTTGFLGTPYLCHVLSRFGHPDVAYQLLLQETYPSWLYPVKMGATTIWERWDGIKPDSTFQTPGMNSFNHYAYGAIGDWMYRVIAGIDTEEAAPGYKQIRIKPTPGGNLTFANADYKTYYGNLSSHWRTEGAKLYLEVEIPANTSATVYLQGNNPAEITEGGKPVTTSKEIRISSTEKGWITLTVGSGKYQFVSTTR